MGEQMRVNAICPDCDGHGEIRVARAVANLSDDGPAQVATALVSERCKTCGGSGKLKGFQPPV